MNLANVPKFEHPYSKFQLVHYFLIQEWLKFGEQKIMHLNNTKDDERWGMIITISNSKDVEKAC
jgi:hypothetical protein